MRCRAGCVSVIVCFGAGDRKLTNLFFNPLLNGGLRLQTPVYECLVWNMLMVQMKNPKLQKMLKSTSSYLYIYIYIQQQFDEIGFLNRNSECTLTLYYEIIQPLVGCIWPSHHECSYLDCFYLDLMHQWCYCEGVIPRGNQLAINPNKVQKTTTRPSNQKKIGRKLTFSFPFRKRYKVRRIIAIIKDDTPKSMWTTWWLFSGSPSNAVVADYGKWNFEGTQP